MAETYFSYFQDVIINNERIKNIFSKMKISRIHKDNDNLFIPYRISDGDTPETIANQFYDTKELFWIILIANDIQDYYYDLPLRAEEVEKLADKYVKNIISEIEENLQTGETLEEEFLSMYGETGDTYQEAVDRLTYNKFVLFTEENDTKREIVYLNPEYLSAFLIETNTLKNT